MRRTRITRRCAGSSPTVVSGGRSFRSASSTFPKFWSRPRRIHRTSGGRGLRSRHSVSRFNSRRRPSLSMLPASVRHTRSASRMRTAWPRLGMRARRSPPWTRRSSGRRRPSRSRSPILLRRRHERRDLDGAVAKRIEARPRYAKRLVVQAFSVFRMTLRAGVGRLGRSIGRAISPTAVTPISPAGLEDRCYGSKVGLTPGVAERRP